VGLLAVAIVVAASVLKPEATTRDTDAVSEEPDQEADRSSAA
jgi:hypothetical protein